MTSFDAEMNASDTYDARGPDTNAAGLRTGSFGSGTLYTGQAAEVMDERVVQLAHNFSQMKSDM